MLAFLGKIALTLCVRRQLEKQLAHTLTELLKFYTKRLRKWMEQMLGAMRNAFSAARDVYRAKLASADTPSWNASEIERDLQMLQKWHQSKLSEGF